MSAYSIHNGYRIGGYRFASAPRCHPVDYIDVDDWTALEYPPSGRRIGAPGDHPAAGTRLTIHGDRPGHGDTDLKWELPKLAAPPGSATRGGTG